MHVSASCGSASRFVDHAFASHESRISSASIAAIAGAVSPHRWRRRRGVVWPALCEFGELAHRVHVEAIAPVLGLLVVHFVHLADILLVTRLHVLAERRPELLVLPRGLAGVVLDRSSIHPCCCSRLNAASASAMSAVPTQAGSAPRGRRRRTVVPLVQRGTTR